MNDTTKQLFEKIEEMAQAGVAVQRGPKLPGIDHREGALMCLNTIAATARWALDNPPQ